MMTTTPLPFLPPQAAAPPAKAAPPPLLCALHRAASAALASHALHRDPAPHLLLLLLLLLLRGRPAAQHSTAKARAVGVHMRAVVCKSVVRQHSGVCNVQQGFVYHCSATQAAETSAQLGTLLLRASFIKTKNMRIAKLIPRQSDCQ
jgi:hypothetical protein